MVHSVIKVITYFLTIISYLLCWIIFIIIYNTSIEESEIIVKKNTDVNESRIFFLDFFRFLAMVFVIVLHVYVPVEFELKMGYPFYIAMCIPIFMISTGFNLSLSDDRKYDTNNNFKNYIKARIHHRSVWQRIKRIVIPFLPLFAIFLFFLLKKQSFASFSEFIKYLVFTGWGPGSYYIPALIQIYLIWPLLHYFSNRSIQLTFIFTLVFTTIFEILINIKIFPEIYYRYYIHRHLPFILCGVLFQHWYTKEDFILNPSFKKFKKRFGILAISFILGLTHIIKNQYMGIKPLIFYNWRASAVPTLLYIFPVLVFCAMIIRHQCMKIPRILKTCIVNISKASFHIYLFQMFYYCLPVSQIGENIYVKILRNLIICIVGGFLYYLIGNKISNLLKRRKIS